LKLVKNSQHNSTFEPVLLEFEIASAFEQIGFEVRNTLYFAFNFVLKLGFFMAESSSNRLLIAGLTAAFVSYLYSVYTKPEHKVPFFMEEALIKSWQKMMQVPSIQFKNILIGINSDVDLIVSGTQMMSRLNVQPSSAVDHHEIQTLQQVEEMFALSFSRGVPTERFVANSALFNELISVAETKLSSAEAAIGGNAALIAHNIASDFDHAEVVLVGPIGPKLKALLHPRISTQNSTVIARDEYHLIMEFRYGETWGDYVAPSYSRFITSHDHFSSSAIIIDMFFNTIPNFRPDLIVLTGLHLLEFQAKELWTEKLTVIKRNLNQARRRIPFHLELGHMSNKEFVKMLLHKVIPYVDSLALSEQELMIISHVGGGPYADQYPLKSITIHAHKATEILDWLLHEYGPRKSEENSKRRYFRLGRVYLHSLTFHMIATRGTEWSNGAASLAAGAVAAAEIACGQKKSGGDLDSLELRVSEVHLVDKSTDRKYRFNAHNPIASWMREEVLFIYTPVLLCKHPAKTVGVAQAVDANALMYSQFFKLY
ncbi:putative ADP-dependent glucokinase, partial [Trichinella pseudospiralis]